jgi:hypothetical protein
VTRSRGGSSGIPVPLNVNVAQFPRTKNDLRFTGRMLTERCCGMIFALRNWFSMAGTGKSMAEGVVFKPPKV